MTSFLLQALVWTFIAGLFHTYIAYPFLMRVLAGRVRPDKARFPGEEDLPHVSVIVCVYNEENIIGAKIDSLFGLDYPRDRLRLYVGSDASSDRTNAILGEMAAGSDILSFHPFDVRQGKPGLLNDLVGIALRVRPADEDHILLFTDANVMLDAGTLKVLTRHFSQPDIAIVDAHMVHTGMRSGGISRAENTYITGEVMLKYREGRVFGCMIGPFGGCYALRSVYFVPVPPNFLVDDFFLAMKAFERGGRAISDLEATCFEAVSHDLGEEFRRKARISAGNFQNLDLFRHLWWPPFGRLGFAFFSHKVLRWLGPFFILGILLGSPILGAMGHSFYSGMFYIAFSAFVLAPCLDYVLNYLNIHWLPLRGLRYFTLMNAALLEGFFNYVKGIKSNVWEPPKRH